MKRFGRLGVALLIANEIRGLMVALPIAWALLHH